MSYAGKWAITINTTKSRTDGRKLMMPHQQNAVDALNEYYDMSGTQKSSQSGLLIMPTGSGKTFTTITWLMETAIPAGYRIVWFVHRQGLVEQAVQEFCRVAPILSERGISKIKILPVSGQHASMSQACGFDINVCSILSAASKKGCRFIKRMLGAQGARKVVVVIDEAHHAPMNSYQKVLEVIRRVNPAMVLLGLTATPKRLQDNQQLLKMFNVEKNVEKRGKGFIYEVTLQQLIQYGYLAVPHYERVDTDIHGDSAYSLDAKSIEFFEKFGELGEGILEKIAQSKARNMCIVNHYLKNKKLYGKTLIFAINQEHAQKLCEEFQKAGVSCNYAISNRPDSREVIEDFRRNKFSVLINVQIMTEGSDVPDIQTVFMTRETNSDTLFMQMVGRGLRGTYAGGTKDAYIVDFHDNWELLHFWFKPEGLDIFNIEDEIIEEGIDDRKSIIQEDDIEKDEEEENEEEEQEEKDGIEEIPEEVIKEMHKIIDENLKTNWEVTNEIPHWPVGWYGLNNHNSILVMNDQLEGYHDMQQFIHTIIAGRISNAQIQQNYFVEGSVPSNSDIRDIVAYIQEYKEMPPYFDLAYIDESDPHSVADSLVDIDKYNIERLTKEALLLIRDFYNMSHQMKKLYPTIGAYKRAVENVLSAYRQAALIEEDERKEFNCIPDYYDINELADEVYKAYPKLRTANLQSITWSERVVKSWLGKCYNLGDNKFKIRINKLLSSPDVSREAIKYVIYHELLHANGLWNHDGIFRDTEWSYPDSEMWDSELDTLSERYKIDYQRLKKENSPVVSKSSQGVGKSSNLTDKDEMFNPKAKGVETGYKYCRNCGHKLPEATKFCDKCGASTQYE